MFKEAAQAAQVVRQQLVNNQKIVESLGEKLRNFDPRTVITCARGSSDHAATYGKYLIENKLGIFTTSAAPSVVSVYQNSMKLNDCVCIVISQSGASPDLLAYAEKAKQGGALLIALVNDLESPLAQLASEVIPLCAGPETSVAATKSYIASLSALAHLVSAWKQDQILSKALQQAPELLERAWNSDWSPAVDQLAKHRSMFVLGRGIGLGIAQEAALKFKEVCGIHAEAFSSAEVLHGPITIAKHGFPVLAFAQSDETKPGLDKLLGELSTRDLTLLSAGTSCPTSIQLDSPSGHPAIEPMARILSFYRMVNQLSLSLNMNPDEPPFLKKVTATV